MNFIECNAEGRFVFVGDTHGDLDASKYVIKNYSEDIKVFLGDYVDKGLHSKENLDFLLNEREKNPKKIYLLRGNHEIPSTKFSRKYFFWSELNSKDYKQYSKIVEDFPLVFSVGKILALHSSLPDIKNLDEINNISSGDENWAKILWGFVVSSDYNSFLNKNVPQLNRIDFDRIMGQLNKNILIRGHQVVKNPVAFDKRILTLFTCSYWRDDIVANIPRRIAIADFDKKREINSIDDLVIKII